jgi:hypothetical protein
VDSLNDPELVRKEYADEKRYATRMGKQEIATGPAFAETRSAG